MTGLVYSVCSTAVGCVCGWVRGAIEHLGGCYSAGETGRQTTILWDSKRTKHFNSLLEGL